MTALKVERQILERLGYPVPKRLRTSSLVAQAKRLKVDQSPLPPGKIYDIIDDIYGDEGSSQDQQRRNRIKSRRHQLQKRFKETYGPPTREP